MCPPKVGVSGVCGPLPALPEASAALRGGEGAHEPAEVGGRHADEQAGHRTAGGALQVRHGIPAREARLKGDAFEGRARHGLERLKAHWKKREKLQYIQKRV